MPQSLRSLLFAMRALAAVLLLVGIAIWAGHYVPWRAVHAGLGALLGVLLLAEGIVAWRATERVGVIVLAAVWTAVLAGYGFAHARLWPGGAHWIAQMLHVLLGLATLGVAERVAGVVRSRATDRV